MILWEIKKIFLLFSDSRPRKEYSILSGDVQRGFVGGWIVKYNIPPNGRLSFVCAVRYGMLRNPAEDANGILVYNTVTYMLK